MATLRDIKQRILGVKSTQQITKAMKMVAAARLRRAQENIINAKPYSRKMAEVISNLINSDTLNLNNLFTEKEVKNLAIIIITSDRGLCGGFNMNAIRKTEELINDVYADLLRENKVHLYCLGKKGNDYFSKKPKYNVVGSYPGIFSHLKFEFAAKLANDLTTKFVNNEYDKVVIVYNEFRSVIQQNITAKQFLPIPAIENNDVKDKSINFIYEPDQSTILNSLLPRYLKGQMWTFLLDSYAAELGARMTAMDMATENAKEIIRTLQIKFNKERQAAITKEILEIVSGANALKNAS